MLSPPLQGFSWLTWLIRGRKDRRLSVKLEGIRRGSLPVQPERSALPLSGLSCGQAPASHTGTFTLFFSLLSSEDRGVLCSTVLSKAQAWNPSTWETGAGLLLLVSGQPGLRSKPLSPKIKKKKTRKEKPRKYNAALSTSNHLCVPQLSQPAFLILLIQRF